MCIATACYNLEASPSFFLSLLSHLCLLTVCLFAGRLGGVMMPCAHHFFTHMHYCMYVCIYVLDNNQNIFLSAVCLQNNQDTWLSADLL